MKHNFFLPLPSLYLLTCSFAACSFATCFFAHAGTIEEQPFFKAITGKWTGTGQLVSNEGTSTSIKEEWEGKFNDDGTFSISGARQWGDDSQDFQWVFSRNPSTELYECEYTQTGLDQPLRLEVSVTDTRIELKAPIGDPGSELKITNSIVGKTIEGTVLFTDSSGTATLKGTVIHTRRKAG